MTRTLAVLLAVALCLGLGACGGSGSNASSSSAALKHATTARTPAAAAPRCPSPAATTTQQQDSDAAPPGTLDALLSDPAATVRELDDALRGLADSAAPLGPQAKRLQTAIAAEEPKPESAIEALARARWQHLDVDGTLQTISDAAVASCGTLFGDQALAAFADELPSPSAQNTVKLGAGEDGHDTETWGTIGCDDSGDMGYAPPEVLVYRCDTGAVAIDLTSGVTHHLTSLLPDGTDSAGDPELTLAGDHLVWITVDLRPASGLTKSSWTSTLHEVDLTGARVGDRVLQTDQHQVDGDGKPIGVADVVAADTGYLLLAGISSEGYSLTDPSGSTLGTTAYPDGDARPEPVGVIDVGFDPTSYVDEATGQEHPYGGRDGYIGAGLVQDGGCGADMLAGSEPGFFDEDPPPDVVHRFTRTASGLTVTKVATSTLFDGTDRRTGDVAALTPSGVLLSRAGEDGWTFYDFAGKRRWTLGDPVIAVDNVAGHIVARNTSGEQLVIDPSTGKEADLPDDVVTTLDSLAPVSGDDDPVGKIAFHDQASDTILIERTEADGAVVVVEKLSYRSLCG